MVYLDTRPTRKRSFMDVRQDEKTRRRIIRREIREKVAEAMQIAKHRQLDHGDFRPVEMQVPYWLENSTMWLGHYKKLREMQGEQAANAAKHADIRYFYSLITQLRDKNPRWKIDIVSASRGKSAPIMIRVRHK